MPQSLPSYRRQPSADGNPARAFVVLAGRRVYLGEHGTPESREAYRRVLAEWAAGSGAAPVAARELTISELCVLHFKYVKATYLKPDGKFTSEVGCRKSCLRILRKLYKTLPAADFGPKKLRAVRAAMIGKGWTRKTINGAVSRLRACFKWAASEELIPASVFHALQTVTGLRAGRTEAPEGRAGRPVPVDHVRRVLPFLPSPVAALVKIQWYTGARAGEIVALRATEIDCKGKVWLYKPAAHKTAFHGHDRTIVFGPKAQRILRRFIESRPVGQPLFSPVEAERERYARCKTHRRKNQKENEPKTSRRLGDHYDVDTYRRAITRACEKAGVPEWTPHRLRHSAITRVKRRFGMEAARAFAGHQVHAMTQHYSREADKAKARSVVERVG
ncbi:MAG: site-specific integrase [Planctomycetota bacterium]|nr:site-specific integrase [Planctomycetota bacterium]